MMKSSNLKVNRTRSIAKKWMRRSGNTKNRPEEKLAANLIEIGLPVWAHVIPQRKLTLNDPDGPDIEFNVDIAVRLEHLKTVVELHGPYHDEKKYVRRDRIRRLLLEHNGWNTLVIHHSKAPILFKESKKWKLEELPKVYREIIDQIGEKLPLSKEIPDGIFESVLRKTIVE